MSRRSSRIDEIMATPGIDLAVIGPGDLATSINKRGLPDDPEVQALMARAEAGILKSGVPIGGVAAHRRAGQPDDRAAAMSRWRSASTGRCSSAASLASFDGHQALNCEAALASDEPASRPLQKSFTVYNSHRMREARARRHEPGESGMLESLTGDQKATLIPMLDDSR